jgi:4-hydroxy-tetrahydrodipicolinate synthase
MGIITEGIIVPMLTPFTSEEELDEPCLRDLTNLLIDKKADVLFPAGSTGEAWALSFEERQRILEIVIEESNGRVPVYCGTGGLTTRDTVQLTKMAEDLGADGTIALTPFYISPNPDELYQHYLSTAKATKLPVIPYANPNRTGVEMPVELVVRLAEIDNIVGIKDSTGRMAHIAEMVDRTPDDFVICQGCDDLFYPAFAVGVPCAVAMTFNIVPDLVREIYTTFRAGDHAGSLAAQNRLSPLRAALALGTFPTVAKEAMKLVGQDVGPSRRPVAPLDEESRERLRQVLLGMEVID